MKMTLERRIRRRVKCEEVIKGKFYFTLTSKDEK